MPCFHSGCRALTTRLGMLEALVLVACASCSASSEDTGFGGSGPGATSSSATGAGGAGAVTGAGGISVGSGVGGGSTGSGSGGGCAQNVDIVFVMDVSTSMGPFLTKLGQEMPVVDAAVKALNLKSTPHYGLAVFVDDMLVANGAKAYADAAALQQDFTTWANFTSSNTQVSGTGYNTTWPENSLDALYGGATQFEWRPIDQTLRIIIHTTDDTFWNGPTTTDDGVPIVHDYKGTVQALQQAQIRVFSFASLLGGPGENEDVSPGWFGPYQGDKSIPDSTGGGVYKLDDVLSGQISLSASINQAVKDSFCEPYPPPS